MFMIMIRLSLAAFCFLVGVASHQFYSALSYDVSEQRPVKANVAESASLQSEPSVADSHSQLRLDESIMAYLKRSAGEDYYPDFRFQFSYCMCPGLIPNQKSYHYGILSRRNEYVADVYIAEAASSGEAVKWMESRSKTNAEMLVEGLNFAAYRWKRQEGKHALILIRSDKFVIQISGESIYTNWLAKCIFEQMSMSAS